MDESPLPPEALAYYARGREARRLGEGHGPLEFARTCDILERWLPNPPASVLDVGGGPGPYAVWLARRSYRVGLVDAVPVHVTQARDAASSAGQRIDGGSATPAASRRPTGPWTPCSCSGRSTT